MAAADETPPLGDLKDSEIFTDTNLVDVIGLKTEVDIQQRKWFNADMKAAKYDGLNKLECTEREMTHDTEHAELCPMYYYTIRMSMPGELNTKRNFFIAMEMEEKFNHGSLMKTRHKADNSWNICKSKTLKHLHFEMCTPKALHDLMVNNVDA